jgi:hypothetical protein
MAMATLNEMHLLLNITSSCAIEANAKSGSDSFVDFNTRERNHAQ